MNRREALTRAYQVLSRHNVENANLEGEILLRYLLGIDRSQLYSDLDSQISRDDAGILDILLERRISGEPSAYITGHREFFGLDFIIDNRVLIPRPETELLVETAISLAGKHKTATIADIGTGCGAIAITLAVNLPETTVFAVDLSAEALEVARENATRHHVRNRIHFLVGNLVAPLPHRVDMIVANLPYVKESDLSAKSDLGFEPRMALDGGIDGLKILREMCSRVTVKLKLGGVLLMEIGQYQSKDVVTALNETIPWASTEILKDLAGIERVIALSLTRHKK